MPKVGLVLRMRLTTSGLNFSAVALATGSIPPSASLCAGKFLDGSRWSTLGYALHQHVAAAAAVCCGIPTVLKHLVQTGQSTRLSFCKTIKVAEVLYPNRFHITVNVPAGLKLPCCRITAFVRPKLGRDDRICALPLRPRYDFLGRLLASCWLAVATSSVMVSIVPLLKISRCKKPTNNV